MTAAIDAIDEICDDRQSIGSLFYSELYRSQLPASSSYVSLSKQVCSQLTPSVDNPPIYEGASLKPKIATPSSLYEVISTQARLSKSHIEEGKIMAEEIDQDFERRKELDQKIRELQQQAGIEIDKRDGWEALGRIASFVGAASSIVTGMGLGIMTGPGIFLIASGALGLFNEVLKDAGWEKVGALFTSEEETQEKIATILHYSMLGLSMGLGVAGLATGYAGGVFSLSELSPVQQIAKVVSIGSLFCKTVTQSFQAYTEYQVQKNESLLYELRAEKSYLDNSLKERVNFFRESQERHDECFRVAKNAIYNP